MSGVLSGKTALVTGGARGIGSAICSSLAEAGAHVIINYSRSESPATNLAETIKAKGGSASTVQFDVADSTAVQGRAKELQGQHGPITILVNNAGIAVDSLLVRHKDSDWQKTLDVNLSGCFYVTKAFAKSMIKAREGRVVNISSVIGEMGNAGQVAYSASKAGMIGLTKSLARELASRSITVNAITPGYITTEMTAEISDELRAKMLEQIPLGRLGSTEDVASLVLFLCSSSSSYITGQVIGINGGMYM